ncbi:MAG: hypothetical protein ACRDIV_23350 [Ktedonobacteraceae bacterium]
MDPATLAHLVINALNQFGPFVGGAAATAIVTDASTDIYNKSKEQAKRLIDAIRHRFQREQDGGSAVQALQTYIGGDHDFASVVKTKIERILRDDPVFSTDLLRIMRSGPLQTLIIGEEAKARDIEMTNSTGTGTQHMQTGQKSEVEGIRMSLKTPDES